MTDDERREMTRNNYAAQMGMLGYQPDGNPKDLVEVVRCKDCKYWVPGVITDRDDFIPPKCGKYSPMVGHSADDFCSLAEQEVTGDA